MYTVLIEPGALEALLDGTGGATEVAAGAGAGAERKVVVKMRVEEGDAKTVIVEVTMILPFAPAEEAPDAAAGRCKLGS